MQEYLQRSIVKKIIKYNLTIGQNILVSTLGIVMVILFITSGIFYAVFSDRTASLIESQSREINKQIVLNYENYINSVIETANFIQFSSLSLDVLDSYDKLQDLFTFNSSIKRDVVSIYLFDIIGHKILGDEIKKVSFTQIQKKIWFIKAKRERNITHFSAPQPKSLSLKGNESVIYLSRAVEYIYNKTKRTGVMLIELNFKTIIDMAAKTNLGERGHILILDDEDALIYLSGSDDNAPFSESKELAIKNFFGGVNAVIDGIEYYININILVHTRWRIVTVNNVNDIALAKKEMSIILIFILFISLSLTTLISFYISKRITHPLNTLKDSMFKLESGDFHTKVEVKGQKEVVSLAIAFNSMIDKIRTLMDRVVDEQRKKRKNELRALQNQINPHFLYNTLDSIVWLAENHRSEDVITTVIALARFFRISISKGAARITVKEEISHIENYLTIQRIRYVDKFRYTLDIAENVLDLKVMKLILQPIVENAIYHGIGDDMEFIGIKSYKDNKFLYFEVENSGYGITEDRILEIYKILEGTAVESSVGMRNVYQRIKLFYGSKADIKISSELDEKTLIKIIIPLNLNQEIKN